MAQRFSYIRILVNDYTAMFDFYNNILQLPLKYGDRENVYCEFETGNTDIALYSRGAMNSETGLDLKKQKQIQSNVMIIIEVENVEAQYIHLQEAGVNILTKPTVRKEWDVKTLHILDPEDNLLEINSRITSN